MFLRTVPSSVTLDDMPSVPVKRDVLRVFPSIRTVTLFYDGILLHSITYADDWLAHSCTSCDGGFSSFDDAGPLYITYIYIRENLAHM
jgi:hypothetical protein